MQSETMHIFHAVNLCIPFLLSDTGAIGISSAVYLVHRVSSYPATECIDTCINA